MVDPFRPRLELFIRVGDGFWRPSTADGIEATLQIDPLGIDLPLDEVYRGVTFEAPPPRRWRLDCIETAQPDRRTLGQVILQTAIGTTDSTDYTDYEKVER